MLAVTQQKFGAAEVLQLSEMPIPQPSAEQVLVKVHATALNRADILQRRGKYPPPSGESEILGLEIAGEVVACGDNVTQIKKGDRVFGLVGGGGYAQYCVIDEKMAMPIPENLSFIEAAAIPEAFFTANETVFVLGELKKDETILIHAGGSGVGTAAIQMAHYSCAKIFVTVGSDEKIKKTLALGADLAINYKTQDFVAEIMTTTNNQGIDVIEDFIGGDYTAKNLSLLKANGRLIQVACMLGNKVIIDLLQIQKKRLQIKGSVLRSRSLQEKRLVTQRFSQQWLPVIKTGKIKPIIDCIFPLTKIQDAHRYMEENKNFGKIVINIGK